MRAAKADQRVGCVAETEKSAANLDIQIGLIAAGNIRIAEVEEARQEQDRHERNSGSPDESRAVAQVVNDFEPTTQENPQYPEKRGKPR